jgi:hypothetical protein
MKPKYENFQIVEVSVSRPEAGMIAGDRVAILEVKKIGDEYRYQVMNLNSRTAWMDENWLTPVLGIGVNNGH